MSRVKNIKNGVVPIGIATSLTAFGGGVSAQSENADLGQAANDPTASVMSFQLQDFSTGSYYNSASADSNVVQFRAAIPFTLGGVNNIFRITLPYITGTPTGAEGWGDITIFNLATFDQSWGRIGVRAVALLPTGSSGISAKKWGLGPAAGFIAPQSWGLWGIFNQNIFTVGGDDSARDVNVSIIQPIVNYQLGKGWSVGNSDMSITYDWVSLPVGISINKLQKIGGAPVQFTVSYEHNCL